MQGLMHRYRWLCVVCCARVEHRLAMLGVVFQMLWERTGFSKTRSVVSPQLSYLPCILGRLVAHG